MRQDLFELATPTWQEDPAFALANIRNYLAAGRDARAEHAAMAQSAADALADARDRLAMYPEAVRGQFEAMLQFARNAAFLQEEHNFYIDQQGIALLRLFYLRVGERLTRDGWLAALDDIFMLDRGRGAGPCRRRADRRGDPSACGRWSRSGERSWRLRRP